jgi:hypothetical protein
MNKLVACALLGFGLTQVLVGCSDDDDAPIGGSGSGTAGSSAGKNTGGSSSAGKSNGGNDSGGRAGSTAGGTGTAGTGTAGSTTAGTAGSATAGTSNMGGEGGVGGEAGMGGETSMGGDAGGMGGSGGEPAVEPQAATDIWLTELCRAKSMEELGCDTSPLFYDCFGPLRPFLSTVNEGLCDGEGEVENDPIPKTQALNDALDALAAACPDPTVDQWKCTFGAPTAKDQACRDADEARRVAYNNCFP